MRILKRVENFIENVQPYVDWQSTFLKNTLAKIKLLEARYGTREVGFREEIANLSNILISMGTAGRTFPSPPEQNEPETPNDAQNIVALSSPDKKRGKKISKKLLVNEAAERFIFSDIGKSLDTIKSTRTTVDLFIEAFGNIPVDQVTGTTAGDFKDLLLGLPANHGKEKRRLPIRDAVQDAKERGLSTLSGKTAKNHFSRLSALWSILVQREVTTRNPWMQWNFNTAKRQNAGAGMMMSFPFWQKPSGTIGLFRREPTPELSWLPYIQACALEKFATCVAKTLRIFNKLRAFVYANTLKITGLRNQRQVSVLSPLILSSSA